MTTTCSSLAICCIVAVVGPGIGSAMSNRSVLVALAKYGELNSSFRQITCAPRGVLDDADRERCLSHGRRPGESDGGRAAGAVLRQVRCRWETHQRNNTK